MNYVIKGACLSVIGNVRNNNEDNLYFDLKNLDEKNDGSEQVYVNQFRNDDNKVFAVFDGMGGEARGERASYIASTILKEYIKEKGNIEIDWNQYVQVANQSICDEMTQKERMGTTMAGVQFCKEYIKISNIGDSRIYILSNDKIKQVSVDHNEAKLQEKLNINTNKKSRLTQYLGIRKDEMIIQPFIKEIPYFEVQKILICSDGITDMLSDNDIENILLQNIDVENSVNQLVKNAMLNGGVDNTTVMVFEISKEDVMTQSSKSSSIIDKIKKALNK